MAHHAQGTVQDIQECRAAHARAEQKLVLGRAQSLRHHVQISVYSHSEARNRNRLPKGGDLREMVLKYE